MGCFGNKFDVITANSAKDGLEILENNSKISIVISDLKMPEMNGLEFIKIAKEKFKKIVYFLLTGYDKNEEISKALLDGLICNYFSKPIDYKFIEIEMLESLKKINEYS